MQVLFLGLFSIANLLGYSASVRAQDKTPAVVDSAAPFDTAKIIASLDAYIETARHKWEVPGLAVAIVQDDKVLLSKGYGVREFGKPEMVDNKTLFAIASNSKAFTSAALGILVDEGKLKWDDPVQKYLPWLKLADPLASNDLRVRDLLCHRSGLGTFSGDILWWGTSYKPREILDRAVHLKPEAPFRARYGYSNLMFLAAGEVIETVSGMSWSEFVKKRILDPLQMDRSITSVRDLSTKGNYSSPHKTFLDHSEVIPWMNWDSMAAAGGIISSVDDMSKWMRLQLREGAIDGNSRLFQDSTAFEMWQPQTIIPSGRSRSGRFPSTHFRAYGLGWSLSDYRGKKLVGHGGGYDGMYSEVLMVPEEKLGIVVLTNSMTGIGGAITYRSVDAFLQAPERDWSEENFAQFQRSRKEFQARIQRSITPVVENTKPSHPLKEYAMNLECPMYGKASVAFENEKLVLKLHPDPDLIADLEHLQYDTFAVRWRNKFAWFEGGTAHFIPDAKGRFVRLDMDIPNDDIWFHELKLQRKD